MITAPVHPEPTAQLPIQAGDSDDQQEEEEEEDEDDVVPQEGAALGDSDEDLDEGQVGRKY